MEQEQIDRWNQRFHLSEAQITKFINWKSELPYKYFGCDSDGITIEFPGCSIGQIVKAKRADGHEIDLTEWETF